MTPESRNSGVRSEVDFVGNEYYVTEHVSVTTGYHGITIHALP
jgi:hypothetical protein